MVRNRRGRFGIVPAAVTITALLFCPCAGAGDVKTTQMGGSIQGAPLSLSGVSSTIAGAGLLAVGSQDGEGPAARFHFPYGISTDGISLFVTDMNNHTIRKVVIATGEVTTVAGMAGSRGSADGMGAAARFRGPSGVTTDGTRLYVADTANNMVRKID